MLRDPYSLGGAQIEGKEIRIGYLTPALIGGPKEGENATPPLHSRGSPNRRKLEKNRLPHPCLLTAQKGAQMLRHPCILGGPQTEED